jgi:hypothetical protein
MATFYWPDISAHYDSFRRILKGQIPDTLQEWEHLRAKQAAQHYGHSFIDIEVNPDEFARHCHATNTPNNLNALENLVFHKRPRD